MSLDPIPLGYDHWMRWIGWSPDRELNPQYMDLPDVERCTVIVRHPLKSSDDQVLCQRQGYCEGAATIQSPVTVRLWPTTALWQVAAWNPLTLTPSILCHCGDHGWITAGRWQPA